MGVQTIVHGRIELTGDFESTRDYIKSLSNDDKYPWIRTEMFSLGASERPYYYVEPIIGFAADYKGLEYNWTSFIIKFENILRSIPFDTAKIQMETEFVGTYNFFWKSKTDRSKEFEENENLIETKDWFFGYGYRSRWGLLDEELEERHVFNIDFDYPIKFDEKTLTEFLNTTKPLKNGEIEYLKNKISNLDKLHAILTYCFTHNMIDYGFQGGKGYWVKKLKEIEISNIQQGV
jgi:hypothetical protein